MALTTLTRVKALMEITHVDSDTLIGNVIDMVSVWFAKEINAWDAGLNISLLEAFTDRVERHRTDCDRFIDVGGWPVSSYTSGPSAGSAAVSLIKEATTPTGLATATALVIDDDFIVEQRFGRVWRVAGGAKRAFLPWVQITYTGGYRPDAADANPTDVTIAVLDPGVIMAADFVVKHLVEHKDLFGQRSFNVGTASVDQVEQGLFKFVEAQLRPLKRDVF